MASIHLARMLGPGGFGKLVAIKTIHPHLATEARFVDMFLDEARIVSQIAHPNVCSVFDFGRTEDSYFLAMEYILGETLLAFLRAMQHRRDLAETTRWWVFVAHVIAEAAEGLHAAHELRDEHGQSLHVIHRDVSPDNIFVTSEGGVKVVDFGVAWSEGRLNRTRSGTIKGKYSYMAPEVLQGASRIDRRVDIWALGVCLWELLTIRRLFRRNSDAACVSAIMHETIPAPSALAAGVPPELDAIVLRALSRHRGKRPATARELGQELRRFVAKSGELMGPVEVTEMIRMLHRESLAKKEAQRAALLATTPAPGEIAIAPDVPLPKLTVTPAAPAPRTSTASTAAGQPRPALWLVLATLLAMSTGIGTAVLLHHGYLSRGAGERPAAVEPGPGGLPALPGNAVIAANPAGQESGPATSGSGADSASTSEPAATGATTEPASAPEASASKRRSGRPASDDGRADRASSDDSRTAARERRGESSPPVAAPPALPSSSSSAPATAPPLSGAAPIIMARPPSPRSYTARVEISALESRGSLPRTEVRSAVDRVIGGFGACYQPAASQAGRAPTVRVNVELEIDEAGWAQRIRVSSSALPGLSSCVAQAARKIRTRTVPDVGRVRVSFAVSFTPTAE